MKRGLLLRMLWGRTEFKKKWDKDRGKQKKRKTKKQRRNGIMKNTLKGIQKGYDYRRKQLPIDAISPTYSVNVSPGSIRNIKSALFVLAWCFGLRIPSVTWGVEETPRVSVGLSGQLRSFPSGDRPSGVHVCCVQDFVRWHLMERAGFECFLLKW